MAKPLVSAGGGWPAIVYTVRKGIESGNPIDFVRRMRSRNACKTCALGMGGQHGGMVNEAGHFPEFCKKSVQAQAGDMAGTISEEHLASTPISQLRFMSSAEFERMGRLAFPIVAEEGDTHFRRVSWDEALDRSVRALAESPPNQVFFYSSGRSSNEAAFLLQLSSRSSPRSSASGRRPPRHQPTSPWSQRSMQRVCPPLRLRSNGALSSAIVTSSYPDKAAD